MNGQREKLQREKLQHIPQPISQELWNQEGPSHIRPQLRSGDPTLAPLHQAVIAEGWEGV